MMKNSKSAEKLASRYANTYAPSAERFKSDYLAFLAGYRAAIKRAAADTRRIDSIDANRGKLPTTINVQEKSAWFADKMRAVCEGRGMNEQYFRKWLSNETGISELRLSELMSRKCCIRSPELQILGLVLGIPLDHVFPLPFSSEQINQVFKQLQARADTGMIAAMAIGGDEAGTPISQQEFEQSVVHLHFCAECLRQFPS